MLKRGMLKPADGRYTTEDDFREAKLAFEPEEPAE